MQWTPLIRILQARCLRATKEIGDVCTQATGSRSWAELPRDTSSGVARYFPLAVEPLNGYSTRGSSRLHVLSATQFSLLLGSKFGLIKGW